MASLIKRAAGGDSSALIKLYDGTSRLVFGLIVRILGDRISAEETLLDVYTQVWRKSTRYDPEIPPLEWLIKIGRDSAVARLHWTKRETRAKQEPLPGQSDSDLIVAPEQQKLARASLASIPSAQREILERAYYGNLSCSEIAAQIGKPVGAVRNHIRLGLSKLGESPESQSEQLTAESAPRGTN